MMSSNVNNKPRQANFFNVCGNCPISCCKGARPPLTAKRKNIIQNFLKTNGFQVSNPFESARDYVFPRETEEGYCVFLDKATKTCQIHPAKPETCVAGPITFDVNVETGKIEWFLKMEKICPLAGVLWRDERALEKHLKSAKREILKLVKDLDAVALRTILAIEEPYTFKVYEDSLDSRVIAKLKP